MPWCLRGFAAIAFVPSWQSVRRRAVPDCPVRVLRLMLSRFHARFQRRRLQACACRSRTRRVKPISTFCAPWPSSPSASRPGTRLVTRAYGAPTALRCHGSRLGTRATRSCVWHACISLPIRTSRATPQRSQSKRQDCLSHSAPEADIVAADLAVHKGCAALDLWDVLLPSGGPLTIHEDNDAMMWICRSTRGPIMRHLLRSGAASVAYFRGGQSAGHGFGDFGVCPVGASGC